MGHDHSGGGLTAGKANFMHKGETDPGVLSASSSPKSDEMQELTEMQKLLWIIWNRQRARAPCIRHIQSERGIITLKQDSKNSPFPGGKYKIWDKICKSTKKGKTKVHV